jgi:hypothetical protein
MPFVIATDSRKNKDTLFMVDRKKCTLSFWSNSLVSAFLYSDVAAAKQKAASFKFNNPRVLSMTEAKKLAKKNKKNHQPEDILAFVPKPTSEADKMLCQSTLGQMLYVKAFQYEPDFDDA